MAGRVVRRCRGRLLRLRPLSSELPRDLLELILKRLDLADHARFASVCSSWRSAATHNPPINKPLYLVLSHDPYHLVRGFITSFIPSWSEARFMGALDGWLVIAIDGRGLFLLNKGFNAKIPLPPPPVPKPFGNSNANFCKAVLSSPPLSSSSDECTVVFMHYVAGLFYCRLGLDNSFTKLLDNTSQRSIQDFLFYEGRLYVLCKYSNIIIFDHLLNKVTQLVAHLGIDPAPSCGLVRLFISENKLLMIAGRFNPPWVFLKLDPVWVFKFEPQSEPNVIRVENMNDNLLLVINHYCSLAITTKEHKEFRRSTDNGYNNGFHSTDVLDKSEDSNKAELDDPWPLFFVMFNDFGIKRLRVKGTKM